MRVLLTTRRGAGHFGPLVPFAQAFLRAGDQVLVAAPHAARPMVVGAGLPFWGFDDPPPQREAIYSSLDGLTDDQKNAMVLGEVFTRLDARAALPGVLDACSEWWPHVVLRETCEFAGYLAAERRGIPHARVGIGLGSSEDFISENVTGVLADLRAELGAGIALERGPAGIAELAEAVAVVLDDSFYRAAAARVASEVRTLPPVDAAPYVLRGLLDL